MFENTRIKELEQDVVNLETRVAFLESSRYMVVYGENGSYWTKSVTVQEAIYQILAHLGLKFVQIPYRSETFVLDKVSSTTVPSRKTKR